MYVPEALKVNRFVDVAIPSNKDYFARLGRQALSEGQYTGDDPAQMPSAKVDQISAEDQRIFDEIRQREIDQARAAAAVAKKSKQTPAVDPSGEPTAEE